MGSRLFCIFQNYFLEKQRESCGVQYKAKKRSVKGMKKMTIFEYLYGDVYYTDEYGNAYFDSCVDIDYELDEIPEIVNLGDHTYFMAKEDLDLYNQYDIRVDGVSEDDLRFLHYTRRPYYQMRGRSVSREQAFDIIRRTDNFFNWDMETIGNRKEFVRCINFDNWLIMKNHYPKGYGWIHADGTVGANAITQKWPTMIELVTEWFYKLKSFPYLDLVIGITNWDEISWDEDDTFEKAIQMGIYVHDKCIELLNKQNAWAKYQEYDEKYGADPERFETDYYQKNGIVQVDEAYLRKCIESYGLDPDEELSKVRPYIWKGEIMEENKMIYKNEDGNYHIRILMLQEQCKQLKLAYPLEVDVCVCEAERSKEWEESIREKIEDALYEMVAPVEEDDFYSDVYRAWCEEIAWNWELEKEGFLPDEKDPFSEMNMDRTLLAYRRLCACLTIVGKQKEIERVFNDGAYAEELFERFGIQDSPYRL